MDRGNYNYNQYDHQQFGPGGNGSCSGTDIGMTQYGFRDKVDQGSGLTRKTPGSEFTTLKHMIYVDTRDCIGDGSLSDARAFSVARGTRDVVSGTVIDATGLGVNPVVVTLSSVGGIRVDDMIEFKGVRGNTNINGIRKVSAVDSTNNTVTLVVGPNGNYIGGGNWVRGRDRGYPLRDTNDSVITGNTMSIALEKELTNIRDISLFHVVIPRDIIPLYYWLSDFIQASVDANNHTYQLYTGGTITTDYTTRIPQEDWYMKERMIGFYSTPLDLWRTYEYGAFSMQNTVTPPPFQLWNPPGPGPWPNQQPKPYPFQTVPTYKSGDFPVKGKEGLFYLMLSGHGVYDLVDWTVISNPPMPITDAMSTAIIRKLVLLILTPVHSYNGVDYIDLILNCRTTSNTNAMGAYGFGDFQRYIPGPGHGLTYQPNTNTVYNSASGSGPPNVPQVDSPIAFPNFRGNVWGPYSSPGDRFQKMGLRDIIQDLYLNGDLDNLLGNPLIVSNIPPQAIMQDPSFGLNFSALIPVTLGNIASATNPNITNAMRIVANGFGAATVRAEGADNAAPVGPYFTSSYENSGGMGPSSLGSPSSWVDTGVYGGSGSVDDPVAQGVGGTGTTASNSTASNNNPTHAPSFYDLGPNNGAFRTNIQNYIGYTVNDIPDNNLVMRVEEALRDERCQSTRSTNGDALMDCPIRLNLGSSAGTQQYVEALQALLAQGTGYWEKRYFNPKASLQRLNIKFYTYDGQAVPLEKMLQQRAISSFLRTFVRVNDFLDLDFAVNPFSFNFLFDPTNPQMLGRVKRYISIIFKATTYQGMPPGNEPTSYAGDANVFS